MIRELRYALRVLGNDFGLAAVVVLPLALGIGANTALFAVVNAAVLRPLPYDHHERLVSLSLSNSRVPGQGLFSLIRVDQLRAQSGHFLMSQASAGTPSILPVRTSQSSLQRPAYRTIFYRRSVYNRSSGARTFLPEEDRDGGRPVVLLSYGL
jgi:hypothetical protein